VTAGADFARRYASWIERRRWTIIAASITFAAIATFAASQLRVFADFSYLLPQNVRSVTDLRENRKARAGARHCHGGSRVRRSSRTQRAAEMLRDRITRLPLVSSVTFDGSRQARLRVAAPMAVRRAVRLEGPRVRSRDKIRQAKLEANPLFVGSTMPRRRRTMRPTSCATSWAGPRPRTPSAASWSARTASCR